MTINEPVRFVRNDFQNAWLTAMRRLVASHWELHNLAVHTRNPAVFAHTFPGRTEALAKT